MSMQVYYYKTNHGIFFEQDGYYNSFSGYVVNGIEGQILPKYGSFYRVEAEALEFKKIKHADRKLVGWKLKNPALESAILPLTLKKDAIYYDNDESQWSGEFGEYISLYEELCEEIPATLEPAEVTLILLGELQIANLNKPEDVKVSIVENSSSWLSGKKTSTVDLSSVVTYDALASLVVPDFMLHNHPCSISSKQVYDIVRAYVKENINPNVARITSDYDFCFTVKKVVTKHRPVIIKEEIKKANGRSYATPKFRIIENNADLKEVFEMTWTGAERGVAGYKGYTVIEPWKAENFADMKEQVRVYLDSLMKVINAESYECPHCKGAGIIFETQETNKR